LFENDMTSSSPIVVRRFAAFFAAVLGLQAAWIMAAELTRPAMPFFPGNAVSAKMAATKAASAANAAWLGWPRGELWSDYAVTANAKLLNELESGAVSGAAGINDGARNVAETAATLAPSDARNWVLLAMNQMAAGNYGKALAQLKMSYYTSPYSDDLFPFRIQTAARSPSNTDEELSSYVEYELGVIVRQKPDLKRWIASAYGNGSSAGRQFLNQALNKVDPAYLAQLKAAKP
jgi:hypothetical protein